MTRPQAHDAGAAWRRFKTGKGMSSAEVWARWRDGDRTAPIPIRPATQPTEHSVLPAYAPDKPKGKRMRACDGAVLEFLTAHKAGIRKSEVVKHFEGRYEKGPVYRAMKALVTAGAIHEAAGMVSIAGVAK